MNPRASCVVSSDAMTYFSPSIPARLLLSSVLAVSLSLAGCGASEVGESCDTGGSADECVDGAICTNEDEGNTCRLVCEEQEDCPMNYSCNGVTGGSTKSCQPDRI
jgi:hypothetical protein